MENNNENKNNHMIMIHEYDATLVVVFIWIIGFCAGYMAAEGYYMFKK